MSSVVLWAHESITIGDHVKIGGNSILIDTDSHNMDYLVRRGQYTDWGVSKPIVIEDDVFIGVNCIILKGGDHRSTEYHCRRFCSHEKYSCRLCRRRKSCKSN